MRNTSFLLVQFLFLTIALLETGCHRSPLMKQEEYSGRDNVAINYYRDEGGDLIVKSVESIVQPRKKILVLDFWNNTPIHLEGLGRFIADEMRKQLDATHRVLLPEGLGEVGKTEDFVEGKRVKVSQLIREGRKLGVAALVIGRIIRVAFKQKGDEVGLFRQKQSVAAIELEFKIFDVSAGREVYSGAKTREVANDSVLLFGGGEDWDTPQFKIELAKGAAREGIADFLPEVLKANEKMIWEGRIARVNGNQIYVNAGQQAGLVVGDILRVFTPGEEIYDPITGAQLGRGQGPTEGHLRSEGFCWARMGP